MNNCMTLSNKIENSTFLQLPTKMDLLGLTFDSREVHEDFAFFAFSGIHTDGNLYIDRAIENGASLIVCEIEPESLICGIGYLLVPSTRSSFAIFNSYFYDRSDEKLKIIGVTGTDGKTTTCCYLYHFLKMLNYKVALSTTVYQDDGKDLIKSPNRQSTPEADVLHSFFKRCVEHDVEYLILETTSHSLSEEMDRLNTIKFEMAIITNITSEHLELHKSIDRYVDAKCNLIRNLKEGGTFISTLDNIHLDECLKVADKHRSFILKRDLMYEIIKHDNILPLDVSIKNKVYKTDMHLDVFVSNALLAAGAASIISQLPVETFLSKIKDLMHIDGRFIVIENNLNINFIVDFAHTADAFHHIMKSLKPKSSRLIALFGSGGERDVEKREQMGKVASSFCDIIILTEEDPRDEGDDKITSDIADGISDTPFVKIYDRMDAIKYAVKIADEGDVVLFLGKGHESSIQRRYSKIQWNEESAVRAAIEERERDESNR